MQRILQYLTDEFGVGWAWFAVELASEAEMEYPEMVMRDMNSERGNGFSEFDPSNIPRFELLMIGNWTGTWPCLFCTEGGSLFRMKHISSQMSAYGRDNMWLLSL